MITLAGNGEHCSNKGSHSDIESNAEDELGQDVKDDSVTKRETQFVWFMRLVVLVVLVTSTLCVAISTYRFTSSNERSSFRESFQNDANKILDSVGNTIHLSLTAMDALIANMVSFARSSNQSWPFVTIPDFELRCAKTRILSKAVVIEKTHFVTSQQRIEWEAYTSQSNWWVNQSIAVQEKDPNFHGPIIYDYYTLDYIHNWFEELQSDNPFYIVLWQSSPVIPRYSPYNWDALSVVDSSTLALNMFEMQTTQLSRSYNLPNLDDPEEVREHEARVTWFKDYVSPGQDPSEPAMDILYPILDNLDEVTIKDPKSHPFVGVLSAVIFWRDLVKDILPYGSNGIVLVVDGTCNPSFTFAIDGPEVQYLGRGDHHDPAFDAYVVATSLLDLESFGNLYAGIDVNRGTCQYSFRVFPSRTYQNMHETSQPRVLTIAAVIIFVFTSCIFLCYDTVVEYRQKVVLTSATKTSKIVSSLYPETVRNRLLQSDSPKHDARKRTFLKIENQDEVDARDDICNALLADDSGIGNSPPIADVFPQTTIFFADLAGFTQWSSQRTPTQVFQLLEAVFHEFDKTARKLKVFKVETIGDCYVAVTGIPKPQKRHAVIMVMFATECMAALGEILNRLAESLGDDTRQLAMRVGLNSGPTTAGVLRGDKGRFQLFGDTVNTASRMESTGVPGFIHVSQSTADELIYNGKSDWLTPREESLEVKGKGQMQTFFVSILGSSCQGSDAYNTYEQKSICTNDLDETNTLDISEGKDYKGDLKSLDWIEEKLTQRGFKQ